MTTNEEAISYLECGAVPSCCCSSNKRHGGDCEGEEKVIEAINMAIAALEKQIPKKPLDTQRNGYYSAEFDYACPKCYVWFADAEHWKPSYCSMCGQAIRWENDND